MIEPNPDNAPLHIVGRTSILPGSLAGLPGPTLSFTIEARIDADQSCDVNQVNSYLASLFKQSLDAFPTPAQSGQESLGGQMITSLLYSLLACQQAAGQPIADAGKVLYNLNQSFVIVVPSVEGCSNDLASILPGLLNIINCAGQECPADEAPGQLAKMIEKLRLSAPSDSNTSHFLSAARRLGIPYSHVTNRLYQYGQGIRAHLMESSFTDHTPQLSAMLARNKLATANALRRACLPVPDHQMVNDEEEAVRLAGQFGFPVVIKPADLDGGTGVAAGLKNSEMVRGAYREAHKHSKQIMLERHVEGRDYRLVVFNGRTVWAIERVPAGVNGDGIHTVRELIESANEDTSRQGHNSPLKPLELSPGALDLIDEQGLTPDAVPEVDRYVRLSRNGNVSSGGTPVTVFEQVHPDNLRLAARAAATLKLDLAGVDLLIPDIRQSWLESDAAICEVNAQPQFGPVTAGHLYPEVLCGVIQGNGRIPLTLILGDSQNLALRLGKTLAQSGVQVGRADFDGCYLQGQPASRGKKGAYISGRWLIAEPAVEAGILSINDASLLKTGLPFDRFDLLVVAAPLTGPDSHNLLPVFLAVILQSCTGPVCITPDNGLQELVENVSVRNPVSVLGGSPDEQAVELARLMLAARERHQQPVSEE
ncbi:hypothetical protein BOW49_04300 [Solemya velum gill symbiont]|uniref:ATP-binding protein n=2 Tax=Solemya velum gill symbiont TaxID=2340 RepID=UPI000998E708|nr:hypothetical protein [Solemya velum gill symbiont]OOZ74335.1 hypothetical protein BOW49_04300 [Solemya velum gill symbiont]